MFKDSDGNLSSGRLIHVIGTLYVLSVWAYMCVSTNEWIDPMSVSVALGTLFAGKVFQKHAEDKPK